MRAHLCADVLQRKREKGERVQKSAASVAASLRTMVTSFGFLVLLISVLSIVCVVTSSDDFRPGYLSANFIGPHRFRVLVNYTATSQPDVTVTVLFAGQRQPRSLRPRHHTFANNQGEVIYEMTTSQELDMDFTFTLPKINVTLYLDTLPSEENRTEPIPDVHFEPKGDFVYAESGDVSLDVTVTGSDSVIDEKVSCTSYVKNGSYFYVSEDWPISIVGQPASDSGAVYRLDFNTSEFRPEGVLVLKALKTYGDRLVMAVEAQQRVDFYQQGHDRLVTPDTVAFVRRWTDPPEHGIQVCDLAFTPTCSVSCAAIGPEVSQINVQKVSGWGRKYPLEGAVTSSTMGFLTVTSVPVPDADERGRDVTVSCTAIRGEDPSSEQEQRILLRAREEPRILRDRSSAVYFRDVWSLRVVCEAAGVPLPKVTISNANDPDNTPLQDIDPDTYMEVFEKDASIQVRLWVSGYGWSRSSVRCTADNGFKEPDAVVLEVTQRD